MYKVAYNIRIVEPVELDQVHPKTKTFTLEEFINYAKNGMLYMINNDYLIVDIPNNVDIKQAKRYIHAELNRYYWNKVAKKEYEELINQLERN